jgi:type I restriction enzyme M protein
MTQNDIVQKLWNLCDVLRDDGINYSDYVTELVMLLFMKMVHENTESDLLKTHILPEGCRWTDLNSKSGLNLLDDYKRILLALSSGKDANGKQIHNDLLISAVYADAQTRLREPAKPNLAQGNTSPHAPLSIAWCAAFSPKPVKPCKTPRRAPPVF